MEEYSYTSTHPLGHTGPVTGSLYLYIHISDCVQSVYELPLLPNNTAVKHFYTNLERCEVLTGYLALGHRPGGNWANTCHWTKLRFLFYTITLRIFVVPTRSVW